MVVRPVIGTLFGIHYPEKSDDKAEKLYENIGEPVMNGCRDAEAGRMLHVCRG